MSESTNRREFLRQSTMLGAGIAGLSLASHAHAADEKPDAEPAKPVPRVASIDPMVIAVIGTGNRGSQIAPEFAIRPDVRIKYLCDVDDGMIEKTRTAIAKRRATTQAAAAAKAEQGSSKNSKSADEKEADAHAKSDSASGPTTEPASIQAVKDLRRVLEDDAVKAVVIATPDHWHTPAAIMALKAGKHVYVEKPCSHNPREGELLVQAARTHMKVVQHGTQRRSWTGVIKAVQAIRSGEIGNVRFVRTWYVADRKSLGRGKGTAVPASLDYSLWQGPAPERPYQDNVLPYNWHWFWTWGTGELGNNGVHFLDMARWALNVDYPTRVTSAGGRYFYTDDWETPDTQTATFEFGRDKMLVWEHRSCQARALEGQKSGISFLGDKGTLLIAENGFTIYDTADKVAHVHKDPLDSNGTHVADFLDAIRAGRRPAADIEDGHKSALLCHLGNIAIRTGRTINVDPKNGHILGDSEAETKYWSREYRPGWEPKV
jgi:predicted dehydrogenase